VKTGHILFTLMSVHQLLILQLLYIHIWCCYTYYPLA